MKNIFKLSVLSIALFLSSPSIMKAQGPPPEEREGNHPKMTAEQRAEKRTEILKAKLQLDDKQTAKVKSVMLQFEKDQEQKMDEMRKSHESLDANLNAIFTPEQQNQFKEMKDKHKENMESKHHPKGTPPDDNENSK